MTNDPKKENELDEMWKTSRILHDEALSGISKKIDEKLSQMAENDFDAEMERKLAEIQELRRQEKEALERSGAHRRKRHSQAETAMPNEETPVMDAKGERPDTKPPESDVKPSKPTAEALRPAAKAPGMGAETGKPGAELSRPGEKPPKPKREIPRPSEKEREENSEKRGGRKAEMRGKRREIADEDARVAAAVDRFFDTAEEIQREESEEPRGLASIFAALRKKKKRKQKKKKEKEEEPETPLESGKAGEPEPEKAVGSDQSSEKEIDELKPEGPVGPDRSLDQSIDRFFRGCKRFFMGSARVTKELRHTRRDMSGETHLTHEKRMARYRGVWAKHLSPVTVRFAIFRDWCLIKWARFVSWAGECKANGAVKFSLFCARFRDLLRKLRWRALRLLVYGERHKMKLFGCFAACVACLIAAGVITSHLTAYEYSYNGRTLGVVKNPETVYKTIDVIGNKLSESVGADIEIDKEEDISFKKIMGLSIAVDTKDEVLDNLTYMKSLKAKAYAITADGRQVAVLQSKEIADDVLKLITVRFAQEKEGVEYKKVGFAQDVKVKEITTDLGKIDSVNDATEYLLTGAVEKKVHVVQKGETFNAIAKSYGLKPSELTASNPGVVPDKLKIGQELTLTQDCPVLTVQTTEVATYTEVIPFEISYKETGGLYKGDSKVELDGANGQKQVVAEIVRNNGQEVSRTEMSSKILSEPVTQVVQVGTKEKPRTVATGSFMTPVRGYRISSKYGYRWGRTHQGIDMACSRGTSIKAADGGTVTFSGYKGSYGYLVIINHGNGKETYYAHCSKLLVSKGAKVYKGQVIAKVGSTGRSTGPHLHFEVHINGTPKNPLNYL